MADVSVTFPAVFADALLQLARATPGEALTAVYERIAGMIAAYGSAADVVDAMRAGALPVSTPHDPLFVADCIDAALRLSTARVTDWDHAGLLFHAIATTSYPRQLEEVVDPPALLFHQGDASLMQDFGIAIVGTRQASEDGIRRAQRAAKVLVDHDIVVISGMALGIDAAAHSATLAAGGRTIAVMGTPITKRYPKENTDLATQILASGGALVTEFAPDWSTQRWDFLRRNRTMSGIAAATLVIEASETSGAKSQALAAVKHGRPVFLPSSLVQAHAWAEQLVHVGINGVCAIELRNLDSLVELLVSGPEHDADLSVV
ncbi:MAG: DNA-protecting protein DprA [Gemmatimonadaceae bacterium]|nr:DNA-protecting protein DprA [Gemmatimonadaceae bacterium]